jgi:uncharacterized delta-60 repeat protein
VIIAEGENMCKSIKWVCIMFVFLLSTISSAQEWVARYNGPGNGDDIAYALAIDNAGNAYVTGWSWRVGAGYEYATLKYDASGVEQWIARYGGPTDCANTWDYAYGLAVDNAGNVYVTGCSEGLATGRDFATVKYDSLGVEQWVARYNGPANGLDEANAITVDTTGNIYVTGKSYGIGTAYDYATVKYDSLGVEKWVARYNGPSSNWDLANAIAVDNLGNVYVTGWSGGLGTGYDYATLKYDSSGVEQWAARYTRPGTGDDCGYALATDNTGNVYVTGWSEGANTGYDYATVKYDSSGVEQWAARYGGPTDNQERAYALGVDGLGNVYVTGWSEGPGTYYDYVTVKYYFSGDVAWVARYNGTANGFDYARALAVDTEGNVYVTGWSKGINTDYDYATVMYDSSGVEQGTARYDGPDDDEDQAYALAVDNAGNVYVTGGSDGSGTATDYATIKYSPTGVEESKLAVKKENQITATIFSGHMLLPKDKKCRVFDITGRVVEPRKIQPGIYFIEVDGEVTQKVVKVR